MTVLVPINFIKQQTGRSVSEVSRYAKSLGQPVVKCVTKDVALKIIKGHIDEIAIETANRKQRVAGLINYLDSLEPKQHQPKEEEEQITHEVQRLAERFAPSKKGDNDE